MDKPHGPFEIELTFEWMMNEFLLIWQPLLLGSLVCGAIAAMLGYIIIRIYWRSHVIGVWKKRLDERKANKSKKL